MNWVDIRNAVIAGLILALLGLVAKRFIARRNASNSISGILTEIEKEVSPFTDKENILNVLMCTDSGPSTGQYISGIKIIAQAGDRLPRKVCGWEGPLCLDKFSINISSLNSFLLSPSVPKRVKEGLRLLIEKSPLPYRLREYNKIWPDGASIEYIKQEYQPQISEKACKIAQEAKRILELKRKIDNDLGWWKWWGWWGLG